MNIALSLNGRFRDVFDAPDCLDMGVQENASVRDLLKGLCERTGRSPDIFFSGEGLKPSVTVTVNGRFIIHLNWLDTLLKEGDRVKVFTLHCGG